MGYGIPDESEDVEIELESGERITEGGTAMMVWARMQFDDVPEEERESVFEALLRYCELWIHFDYIYNVEYLQRFIIGMYNKFIIL